MVAIAAFTAPAVPYRKVNANVMRNDGSASTVSISLPTTPEPGNGTNASTTARKKPRTKQPAADGEHQPRGGAAPDRGGHRGAQGVPLAERDDPHGVGPNAQQRLGFRSPIDLAGRRLRCLRAHGLVRDGDQCRGADDPSHGAG